MGRLSAIMRLVTCARESMPAFAQACRIGVIPRIRVRVVWSSRGLRRGGIVEPCRMMSNQTASWLVIVSGRPAVLASKYWTICGTRSSIRKPASARTSSVETRFVLVS